MLTIPRGRRDGFIVVLGDRPDDVGYLERAAQRAEVIYVDNFSGGQLNGRRPPFAMLTLDYAKNFDRMREALVSIASSKPILGVLAQTESALVAGQLLTSHFLPHVPSDLEATEILRDKVRMREHLAASGFDIVPHRLGATIEDVMMFLDIHGTIVLKPRKGVGSDAIAKITNRDDAVNALKAYATRGLTSFLMEEYIDGPEFSVETFSLNGEHKIFAITQKYLFPNHIESAHVVPASIGTAERESVEAFIKHFLAVVGLKNGPAHTEIRLSSRGPRIIESQNRVGGDKIALLVKLVYGIDLFDLSIDHALGEVKSLPVAVAQSRAAAVCFTAPISGIVRSISGTESAKSMSGVVSCNMAHRVGAALPRQQSSYNRPASVVAVGATAPEALANARAVVNPSPDTERSACLPA